MNNNVIQLHSNAFLKYRKLIAKAESAEAISFYEKAAQISSRQGLMKRGEIVQLRYIINRRCEDLTQALKPAESGIYTYTPEMGEPEPACQIRAERAGGGHYFVDVPEGLTLKGRGIQITDTENRYYITRRAFEKLSQEYTVSQGMYLD